MEDGTCPFPLHGWSQALGGREELQLFRLNFLILFFCTPCPITPNSPVFLNFSILTCHMVQAVGNLAVAGLSHASPAHHLQVTDA